MLYMGTSGDCGAGAGGGDCGAGAGGGDCGGFQNRIAVCEPPCVKSHIPQESDM